VARGHPQWLGVARWPPLDLKGVAQRPPPLAGGGFLLLLFLFSFGILIFLNKNKFIYLFFNKFIFFITMDMCRHLIRDTWHLTEFVKKFNRI
jgi:hypothetical protein